MLVIACARSGGHSRCDAWPGEDGHRIAGDDQLRLDAVAPHLDRDAAVRLDVQVGMRFEPRIGATSRINSLSNGNSALRRRGSGAARATHAERQRQPPTSPASNDILISPRM